MTWEGFTRLALFTGKHPDTCVELVTSSPDDVRLVVVGLGEPSSVRLSLETMNGLAAALYRAAIDLANSLPGGSAVMQTAGEGRTREAIDAALEEERASWADFPRCRVCGATLGIGSCDGLCRECATTLGETMSNKSSDDKSHLPDLNRRPAVYETDDEARLHVAKNELHALRSQCLSMAAEWRNRAQVALSDRHPREAGAFVACAQQIEQLLDRSWGRP